MIEKTSTLFQRMASQICESIFIGLSYGFHSLIAAHEVLAQGFPETIETPPMLAPKTLPNSVQIAPPPDLAPALQAFAKRGVQSVHGNVSQVHFGR